MDRPMSALEAIALSQRENRIVHLRASNQLAADLHDACEDCAIDSDVSRYGDDQAEDGSWTVHLHKTGA